MIEEQTPSGRRSVGLFVTCLVDLFRPTVAFASIKLLRDAGCDVVVPEPQTCCGQPAYNSGDLASARELARVFVETFRAFDFVVAPSASCAGMVKTQFPSLLADDPALHEAAQNLADRTYELTAFLTDVLGSTSLDQSFEETVTYHDSCSALRDLSIKEQPRKLLRTIQGLELREMIGTEICCGFGGTFCVKFSEVSTDMVSQKTAAIRATGAKLLLSGDLGCLLNLAGRLAREKSDVEVRHVAEVLAGMTDQPAIARGSD